MSRFYPLNDVATVACCLSSDQMQLARNAKASINNVTMRTVPFVTFVEWVFSQCKIDLGRIIGTLKTYKPKDENNTYMYASQFRRDKERLIRRDLRIMVTH